MENDQKKILIQNHVFVNLTEAESYIPCPATLQELQMVNVQAPRQCPPCYLSSIFFHMEVVGELNLIIDIANSVTNINYSNIRKGGYTKLERFINEKLNWRMIKTLYL